MQIADIKNSIVSKLNELPLRIKAIVLYGSFARGTPSPDSDIDLLFLSDEIDSKKHRRGQDIARIKECLS